MVSGWWVLVILRPLLVIRLKMIKRFTLHKLLLTLLNKWFFFSLYLAFNLIMLRIWFIPSQTSWHFLLNTNNPTQVFCVISYIIYLKEVVDQIYIFEEDFKIYLESIRGGMGLFLTYKMKMTTKRIANSKFKTILKIKTTQKIKASLKWPSSNISPKILVRVS